MQRSLRLLSGRFKGIGTLITSSSFNKCCPTTTTTSDVASIASLYSYRHCSVKASDDENPVNLEEFTLKEEIVTVDLEAQRRWQEVGDKLEKLRLEKAYDDIVACTEEGLKLVEEVGDMRSPIQCRPMLLLEKAQAEMNSGKCEAASVSAGKALELLQMVNEKVQDAARIAEVKELIAYATLRMGKVAESRALFESLITWMDTDAKKAMPMVAVAAINMRPMVTVGLGMCLEAEAAAAPESNSKELYGKALDKLIDPLNELIEKDDMKAVKETLNVIVRCFVGLGDQQKAVDTCKKYVMWCKRYSDTEGVTAGKELLVSLCTKYDIVNPMIAIELAEAEAAIKAKAAEEEEAAKNKAAEEEAKKE